ncbi:MAG: AMP-binding protein [Methanomassiliicoccales archaeon]
MKPLQRLIIAYARTKLLSTHIAEDEDHALAVLIEMKVRRELRKDKDFQAALGRSRLSDVSRQDLIEYQLHKFRRQMKYTDANSIYYHNKFKSLGLMPDMIRTREDLIKVPVTEPADLAEEPYSFLCVSQSKVMRAFTTSGTSGQRKRLFYTQSDVLNIVDSIAAALRNCGMNGRDTLHIMFPAISAWDPSLMLDSACKVAGLSSNVCSAVDVDEQMKSMTSSKVKVIIGLTSFIYRITILAKAKYDLRQFGVKAIICSSEPLSEAMRREIEAAWGCKACSQYGMTEMGLATTIECFSQDGLHIDEGNYMVECVDQEGKHTKERQPGELIWTSLNMEGSPLLRYRSYDLSAYIESPCSCGHNSIGKIAKPMGRINFETKIGYGEKVYPLLFDEAVLSVSGVLGYQVVIDKVDFRDKLTLNVEFTGDTEGAKKQLLEKMLALDEVRSSLDNDLLAPLEIEVVSSSSGFTPKKATIIDNRKQYDKAK